jgi:hypothetical protein
MQKQMQKQIEKLKTCNIIDYFWLSIIIYLFSDYNSQIILIDMCNIYLNVNIIIELMNNNINNNINSDDIIKKIILVLLLQLINKFMPEELTLLFLIFNVLIIANYNNNIFSNTLKYIFDVIIKKYYEKYQDNINKFIKITNNNIAKYAKTFNDIFYNIFEIMFKNIYNNVRQNIHNNKNKHNDDSD